MVYDSGLDGWVVSVVIGLSTRGVFEVFVPLHIAVAGPASPCPSVASFNMESLEDGEGRLATGLVSVEELAQGWLAGSAVAAAGQCASVSLPSPPLVAARYVLVCFLGLWGYTCFVTSASSPLASLLLAALSLPVPGRATSGSMVCLYSSASCTPKYRNESVNALRKKEDSF